MKISVCLLVIHPVSHLEIHPVNLLVILLLSRLLFS
jgi:hypothetical protein